MGAWGGPSPPQQIGCSFNTPPAIPTIWFGPRSAAPYDTDFYNLFGAGASEWPVTKAAVKAFETSIQWQTTATNAQIQQVLAALVTDNIGYGMDMLALTGTGGCGVGVEGYADAGQCLAVAQAFKALGADPQYSVMDEPLWYGRFYTGTNACNSSLATLTADIANKVAQVRTVWGPSYPIGEAEPISAVIAMDGPTVPSNGVLTNLGAWFDAFATATGTTLAFFRLDMDWTADWQPWIVPVQAACKARGIQFQVIYDGNGGETSDAQWTANVAANAAAVEQIAIPDVAMFQSFDTYPTLDLPETTPTTFTGIIKTYLASH
jgi:hypothetical protein